MQKTKARVVSVAKKHKRAPIGASLDRQDLQILACVQLNNQRPLRDVARSACLSAPAVARRLQRLRATGVISRDVSILDPVAIGRPLTLIVEVSVDSEVVDQLDAIQQRFIQCPAVQQCYYVTGDVDFVLIVSVVNMDEYVALTRTLFLGPGNVRHFRTLVAMERLKVTEAFPLV